jgi:hypothetical protein
LAITLTLASDIRSVFREQAQSVARHLRDAGESRICRIAAIEPTPSIANLQAGDVSAMLREELAKQQIAVDDHSPWRLVADFSQAEADGDGVLDFLLVETRLIHVENGATRLVASRITDSGILASLKLEPESGPAVALRRLAQDTAAYLEKNGKKSVSVDVASCPGGVLGMAQRFIRFLQTEGAHRDIAVVKHNADVTARVDYTIVGHDKARNAGDPKYVTIDMKVNLVDRLNQNLESFQQPIELDPATLEKTDDYQGVGMLAVVGGATTTLDPQKTVVDRQLDCLESILHPSAFKVQCETRSEPDSPYGAVIEVEGQAREPQVHDGQAFAPIRRGEKYAIRIINRSEYDAAVEVWIDGMSMFQFTEPEFRQYRWIVIPAKGEGLVRGWHRNNGVSDAFEVTAYSKSAAATVLPQQKRIGTMTLVFRRAWEPGHRPPNEPALAQRSEGDATGRGPSVVQVYKVVNRIAGVPCAAVTIRYTKEL